MYIICFAQFISGCTGLRKLPDGQKIVAKNTISFEDRKQLESFGKVKEDLRNEISPKPNGKFLWMRPGLSIYNSIKESQKERGFKHWLKYKLGQAPALFDEDICNKLSLTFENRLYHRGYFNAQSEYQINEKKKTVQISYFIKSNKVFKIDTLIFPEPVDLISREINKSGTESLIEKGMSYDLELLKAERNRIDLELKNLGYYYFSPDHLIFEADTTKDQLVKLRLLLKNDNPKESERPYHMDKIYVAEDFQLNNYNPDTTSFENYTVISVENYMKSNVLLSHVFLQKDSLYSKKDHNNTLKQLMGIGAYKYVNTLYSQSPDHNNKLDALLTLIPSQKMAISTEFNVVNKSNNFAGPGVKFSFKNRNFLRGAEIFSVNLNGRFERQVNSGEADDTAYEISVDANLAVPRIIPFKSIKKSMPYVPFTQISIGSGIYARVSMYKFNTFNSGLEYTWRKSQFLTHMFKPIDISFTELLSATDEFKDYLLLNPSIRKSFEEQFIIGSSYNIIFNHLSNSERPQYYLSLGADPSGNLIGLLHSLISDNKNSPDEPVNIFGAPISQYFRFRLDARYYLRTGKESKIATRLHGGLGLPIGNSTVMPYVKQFYSGGTNSIRAFTARSIGPGAYEPPESSNNLLIDQTGEIKLEANAEYRFPLAGYLKGALFADFGNIWLVNEDSLRPGGKFDVDTFYKEIAVGLGFGLRVDVDLIVLRFDWAFPVRKPWLAEGERWLFKEINLFDSSWRRKNLLLNISIGYPF